MYYGKDFLKIKTEADKYLCNANLGVHKLERIVYIHGANSSPITFNFLKNLLPEHEVYDIAYSVDIPFIDNEKAFEEQIQQAFGKKEFSLIGHSMGGLFSARLLNTMNNAKNAVTISAPFGGSRFIEYLRWICPTYQLFKDIKISSDIVQGFKTYKTQKGLYQIVTHGGGNPLIGEPNDGTVTLRSQETLNEYPIKRYELNHFEVLLSPNVAKDIQSYIYT